MIDDRPFRARVAERLRAALGEPEMWRVAAGELYRWTLPRPVGMNMYVTLDSPEHPNLAHIMVSDGPDHQDQPVRSFTCFSMGEVEDLIVRILGQWRALPGRR